MTCRSPAGNLWLLLEDGEKRVGRPNGWSTWFNLETGEVRELGRDSAGLIKYGWEEVP